MVHHENCPQHYHANNNSNSNKMMEENGVHRDSSHHRLVTEERALRQQVVRGCSNSLLGNFLINGYSAILVFLYYLISLESLFSIALSVGLTVYAANKHDRGDGMVDGSIMNWVLLSFAVITPMSASIGMAFIRREQALSQVSVFRSSLLSIYSAHAVWDWDRASAKEPTGRLARTAIDWEAYTDKVMEVMAQLCVDMTRWLTLPMASRARHRVTTAGKTESKEIMVVSNQLRRSILQKLAKITLLCEEIKKEGLLPNEATRIRNWERDVAEQVERLQIIKKYRTPQALRSFARLFSMLLPPFYAPFYGQMASDLNSLGTAICFSIFTAIALTSLFETISQIEDPFVGIIALDGIDIYQELQVGFMDVMMAWRKHCFPNAKPFVLPNFPPPSTRLSTPHLRLLQSDDH